MTRDKASDEDVRKAGKMAKTIVRHHLGASPAKIHEIGGGRTNFVYAVANREGEHVIRLSLEPSKIRDYLKEQWAIERAREVGVPAPEVLEVGAEIVETPFMVLRKVPGSVATHHAEQSKILHEMGRYTAQIHTIRTNNYGPTFDWSSNQLSRKETWKEYLRKELKLPERLDFLEEHDMLAKGQMRRLRSIVREMEKSELPPVLNHGDMRLKNVMVNAAGEITAIIDWENCTSNVAPYWDLSVALHDLSIDAKQAFLEGYGMSEKDVRRAAPIVKALNILNYVPYVADVVRQRDKAELEQYRTRLSGALDLYSL